MSEKREFVRLALEEGVSRRALFRRFGISPPTGYKLLRRYELEGDAGLAERSRRPHCSPARTGGEVESAVLAVRASHPCWGGRKIRARLLALGFPEPPAASTITEILRRHGQLGDGANEGQKAFQRFEHDAPNRLWQMDFKGHFATNEGRCHPLTILDDHSRFNLCLAACENERTATVKERLIVAFQRYGMPERMAMDNGSPWGNGTGSHYTPLTVWLLKQGVEISHSRPYHPQTLGKDERFHRTLKAEVLAGRAFRCLDHCQEAFDDWREIYNLDRPHEALGLEPPISRYHPSIRTFLPNPPEPEYGPGDHVRKVQEQGWIAFRGRDIRLPKAFKGERVALRPSAIDGVWDVCFGARLVAQVDLRDKAV